MLATGMQVRMARSGLKWSGKELAEKAGVGLSTIRKIESCNGIPRVHVNNIQEVTDAFLATGRVRFEGETGVSVNNEKISS